MKTVLAILAICLPTVGIPTAGIVYKTAHAPKEIIVYKDKLVYQESGGKCMFPTEAGTVTAYSTETYAEPDKDTPKGTRTDTRVAFQMPDGRTRICNWDHMDLTQSLGKGMKMTALGGERIL